MKTIRVTQKKVKDDFGNEISHFGVVNRIKNEIRFKINGKIMILTMQEYEILKDLQNDMIV